MADFRLILLVVSLYKILAKLLASRLKTVLGGLISSCQTTFVPGRQILDIILVYNEVVDQATREKKDCLMLKVDFEKACD